jgi:selenocysteine-specific elongation factor
MVLATPGKFRVTRRIDTRLELLPSAPKMKQRSRVHFHAGTCETVAELIFYAQKELAPGQNAFAQLRLQDDVLVLPGDRFIVRQFSPLTTIGGGVILDPLARRHTLRDTGRAAFLEILERGDRAEMLGAMAERAVLGITFEDIVARTDWLEDEIRTAAKKLTDTGRAKVVSAEPLVLLSQKSFDEVRQKIAARIEKFHKENPLLPGISREDLRSSLGKRVRPETFRATLDDLLTQKKLETHGEIVKRAGAAINLDPEETRAKEQIEKAFATAGLAVPSVKEVLSKLPVEAKRAEKILQILLRDKNLVRVTPDLIFHRDALAQLRDRLSVFKKTKGERISVPGFKELTGITRKYAIPLLEYLDRERVTRRAGDERVIL